MMELLTNKYNFMENNLIVSVHAPYIISVITPNQEGMGKLKALINAYKEEGKLRVSYENRELLNKEGAYIKRYKCITLLAETEEELRTLKNKWDAR